MLILVYLMDFTPTRAEVGEVVSAVRSAVAPRIAQAQPVPDWERVYLIMLENRNPEEIIGAADAPYLNELAAEAAIATNVWAVAGASQPNYLALTSGSTHFVTTNDTHDIAARSIFDQLEEAGRTWRVYAENVPPGCFSGDEARGSEGPGVYTRAHQPAISYDAIRRSPRRCANIQGMSAFDPTAASFELIIPDSCHNTHDCPVATGDAWLRGIVPRILSSPGFRKSGLLVITFDGGSDVGPNDQDRLATILVGAGVRAGAVTEAEYSHYNVLRTIQEGLGLPCLERSCIADTMADAFVRPTAP
jgi:hypothetical protein